MPKGISQRRDFEGEERVILMDYPFIRFHHFTQVVQYVKVKLFFIGSVTGNLQGN